MARSSALSPIRTGFTLIEMLIVITITLLLVGGGIASYITFNDRQTLVAGGDRLEVLLRTAQKRARAGDTPAGCVQLQSYNVVLTAASNQVQLQAECSNQTYPVSSNPLAGNVVATSTETIKFRVLAGGVENAGVFTLQNGSTQLEVEVTAGGSIVNLGIVEE